MGFGCDDGLGSVDGVDGVNGTRSTDVVDTMVGVDGWRRRWLRTVGADGWRRWMALCVTSGEGDTHSGSLLFV